MKPSNYRIKREVEQCYRSRGRQRPSPADEDAELRRAWEREMERERAAIEAAAEQAEDDEFWREQQP